MELVLLHYKAPLNYRNQYTDRENIYSTFTDAIRRFRGEPAKSMYTPIFAFPKNMTQHAASSLENPAYPSNENGSDGSKSRVSHIPSSPKQVDGTKDKKKRGNHSTIVPKDLTQQQNVDPITPSQSNNVANPKPSFVDSTADAIKERNDSDLFNISSLDIRVGQIVRVWPHESADKLFCEEILVGEDQPRLIASGLRPFYSLEEMQNQRVLVLANLKARNLVSQSKKCLYRSHIMSTCCSY
jgi:aminoacyl tRNA synthase complex-interacting multifunctional protein 1